MENKGKIIAVVGTTASGKSSLIRELERDYRIEAFYEGEAGDFPDFLKGNLARGDNYLQTELYFLNRNLNFYLRAMERKAAGQCAVLDTYWMTVRFFLTALKDHNERRLLLDLLDSIAKVFPPPDEIVLMDPSDDLVAKRISERGRPFEENAAPIAWAVGREHRTYFGDPANHAGSRLTVVNPESFDVGSLAERLGLERRTA